MATINDQKCYPLDEHPVDPHNDNVLEMREIMKYIMNYRRKFRSQTSDNMDR